ncbi:hypothetical protein AAG570_004729 [Ranatra chinensis]|uniref:DNA repair and recombination protein RAD54-like n=1 Tax=Ranatra chinensis TaxID=642074 RepID=A0ABD0YGB1_9HEMI
MQGCGGVLGDEMGLGKTIQIIAYLAGLYVSKLEDSETGYQGLGPSLIVCPTTVMHQWVREFHTWFPPLRVAILHDSGTYGGRVKGQLVRAIHSRRNGVIITSYEGLVKNKEVILRRPWHYVILDEGHKIRNPEAQVTLVAKEINTPHRLILSGSPLQNNLRELWSLFDFVFPGKLGTLSAFMSTMAVPIIQGGYTNASETQVLTAFKCATIVKDTITPFLLRRMKEDVGASARLPGKTEQVLFCRLTDEQRAVYKAYTETIGLEHIVHMKRAGLFVALINLRKICNHPDLYTGGPSQNFQLTMHSNFSERNEERFGHPERSGKMIVIKTLLRIWKKQGHRVLLFTQGKKMMTILEDFVSRSRYKYLRLDGMTSISSRQPLIDKFNKDPSYFIMLLTTRVGGLGVNLTGADRVVIYDPDWNPAVDTQARERAWRIGQTKNVTIYRLVMSGTIEEKIYHRQIYKQFLSNKVLKDPKQRRFFKSNHLLELFSLSETVKGGTTETAAIFAGTGSEVKLSDMRPKYSPRKEAVPPQVKFSESKIEEMKRLAHLLSQKIVAVRNDDEDKNDEGTNRNDKITKKNDEANTKNGKAAKDEDYPVYGPDGNLLEGCNSPRKDKKGLKKSDRTPKKKSKKRKHTELGEEEFAEFEGHVVPHLLKCRADKGSKKHKYMSQDDYVLHKLFSKTGIETAMRHDTIMEGGPSDFSIVEAEASRVAEDAVRALRESRAQVPVFRRAMKTKVANNNNQHTAANLMNSMKNRSIDVDCTSNEKSMLAEVISWMSSQGGTASTSQLVEQFSRKVGTGQSPLFKSLLKNVATFYRAPDNVGYWTIKEEFK